MQPEGQLVKLALERRHVKARALRSPRRFAAARGWGVFRTLTEIVSTSRRAWRPLEQGTDAFCALPKQLPLATSLLYGCQSVSVLRPTAFSLVLTLAMAFTAPQVCGAPCAKPLRQPGIVAMGCGHGYGSSASVSASEGCRTVTGNAAIVRDDERSRPSAPDTATPPRSFRFLRSAAHTHPVLNPLLRPSLDGRPPVMALRL
jgi:hypothetical protein